MNSTQNTLVFKIRKDGYKDHRKMALRRSVPILLIALASGTVLGNSATAPKQLDIQTLFICLLFGLFAMVMGMIRGLKRQKFLLDSFRLTITNEMLVREQQNTPTISLDKTAITSIVKIKNGSFLIRGDKPADVIDVPFQVENYEDLENALVSIRPIEINDKSAFGWMKDHLLPIVTISLMICFYAVNYKPVVLLSGISLIALMSWSFVKTRRSRNVDDKTKRSMWWVMFVLFFVVLTLVYKLSFPRIG